MDSSDTPAGINHDRRRFLGAAGAAALAAGAAQLGMTGSAHAQTEGPTAGRPFGWAGRQEASLAFA
jgi:nitrous oxide reductase